MKRFFAVLIGLGFLLIGTGSVHAVNYSYTYLDIPGQAVDMNNNGTIVGQYSDQDGKPYGFTFKGASWSSFDPPPDVSPEHDAYIFKITAINDREEIVGDYHYQDFNRRGFRFQNNVYTYFYISILTYISDINNAGVMAGYSLDQPWTGFSSDGNAFTFYYNYLDYPERGFLPDLINDQGVMAGRCYAYYDYTTATIYPCITNDGTIWTKLEYPGATNTSATAINNLGIIVGHYADSAGKIHGFTFNGTIWKSGNYPGAIETIAYDINDKGLIVGSYKDADGKRHGFSYINGVWSSLDYPGATDTYARLVNNNGLIVGSFTKDGQEGQFLATPLSTMAIDIRPWNGSNLINHKDRGLLPVAILSNSEFDAVDIMDLDTITFGRTGDEHSMAFCSPIEWNVNRDSYKDLVCFFWIQRTGFQCGDTQGVLKGTTQSGIHVEAKDSVRVIPCK
jgi:probable HAF family extracellular repeat protein